MQFDPTNKIVQLCAAGMNVEGEPEKAFMLFQQAWDEAITPLEKCIAAHYVARHQPSISEKLEWDRIALRSALALTDEAIRDLLPSLYLNIGKCYEDLNDVNRAQQHYLLAQTYAVTLPDDGYSGLIRNGIKHGLDRLAHGK